MTANDTGSEDFANWDPDLTRRLIAAATPLAKRWFRPEVRGLESFPVSGGALAVSNHSGGVLTPDVLIFAAAFYNAFQYQRPLYTLGHDALFLGPLSDWLTRVGLIHASGKNAAAALRSGGVVLTFPGGVYDAYRPTLAQNVIDFNGRVGYVRTAIDARVPIVPTVSIGGQESQLFLNRGTWLAKRLGLKRLRSDILPVTIGFPFGLSVLLPVNVPLPTKIVAEVLEPIDIFARFGESPDVDEVDAHVRSVMQKALNRLARQRRLPLLG
ncbi:lysophospholipid acyltransferase family protein [Mycobacterium sp.]|uniref:lysophospholipid acyltransferase family protein n=1 Tax=Mycobacterium sp. TaxID=1785 RepID=UPI003C783457